MNQPAPEGALAGVLILDLSRVLAGPYASMMLADFGADVIKVESPAGDDTRSWTPPVDEHGVGTYFSSVNRNSVVDSRAGASGSCQALSMMRDAVTYIVPSGPCARIARIRGNRGDSRTARGSKELR